MFVTFTIVLTLQYVYVSYTILYWNLIDIMFTNLTMLFLDWFELPAEVERWPHRDPVQQPRWQQTEPARTQAWPLP